MAKIWVDYDGILSRAVEIEPLDNSQFAIVRETLTRMGHARESGTELVQVAHILSKKGKYFIIHFKLLYELDGRFSTFGTRDEGQMNTIAALLERWGMVKIVNKDRLKIFADPRDIDLVRHGDKQKWNLVARYKFGRTAE